ncbi:hypothetical protein C5167_047425 [Papaver somniferum]|uniref:Uncharacterized protein n=1 Tax=Papaver somniferum TaxID=3469 RepID=A0A4Y7LK72_PAPSO|nr:hypothetical protein C5167_047425 [Papaver somniferum]
MLKGGGDQFIDPFGPISSVVNQGPTLVEIDLSNHMRVKIDCLSSRYLAQEAVANTISSIKVSKKNFTNDVLEHQLKCGISSNVDQHDIAIVGGGMVGIALACALYLCNNLTNLVAMVTGSWPQITSTALGNLGFKIRDSTFHCIKSFLFLDFLASILLTRHLNVAIIDSNPALGRIDGIKKGEPRVRAIIPATVSFCKGKKHHRKKKRTILVPRVHLTIQTPTGIGKGNQDNSPIEVHQIIRSLTYITREANTDTIIIVIIAINNPTCSPEELIVQFRFQNHGSLDNRASCH